MKFWQNMTAQILLTWGQIVNLTMGITPSGYQTKVSLALTIIQAVLAAVAHVYNPDGTPASEPYIKPNQSRE